MGQEQQSMQPIRVFAERGRTRTFAGAKDWPGWCRSGRSEMEALARLLSVGPRYAGVVRPLGLAFQPPAVLQQFLVDERVTGSATTDFGAPDAALAADADSVAPEECLRLVWILTGCFRAFEAAAQAGECRALRKGPRSGGRQLPAIVLHVLEANCAYLQKLAWRPRPVTGTPVESLHRLEAEVAEALTAAAAGRLPRAGPRGGRLWTPRFFARRAAWHLLDHAWEIEDRLE